MLMLKTLIMRESIEPISVNRASGSRGLAHLGRNAASVYGQRALSGTL